ncbi:hypothetical protein H312_00771 [Anncaliia algerae PRA339]|uniref:RING-type domain-containing protein n=1 Tax=Anncaliia algerae PRA339 TaxID=1288291 RepID=A0A059F3T3_9MICR|nr:hypothetical protein H312_00771 [Anncaliia algerae PRA339]
MDNEEGEDSCPICLCNYTTTGDHKIVSLKCGHLFGKQCIESWFNRRSTALCPKCCMKSKKTEIRPVFASKIIAIDSVKEEETIKELNQERKLRMDLQIENDKLKTTINYLNNELLKKESLKTQTTYNFLHKRLLKKFHTKVNKNSILIYEKMNNVILFSFLENKLGIKKFDANTLKNVEFFGVNDFFTSDFIKDIKPSPFNDGIFGIVYQKFFKLFTSFNNKEAYTFTHDRNLTSFDFDDENRHLIFLGCEDGKVSILNLETNRIIQEIFVAGCPIHSICKDNEILYCAGFLGVYKIIEDIIEKVEGRFYPVCTNLFSDGKSILATFRNESMTAMHYLLNTDLFLNLGRIHYRRNRDKIFNNYLFTVDDSNREIVVFDIEKWKVIYKYKINEEIIDFVSSEDKFFLLTEGGIYVFID